MFGNWKCNALLRCCNCGAPEVCLRKRLVADKCLLDDVGGVAVHFIGVIYLFLGIAIVCDDFFVASLEAISEKLKLSEDVAGMWPPHVYAQLRQRPPCAMSNANGAPFVYLHSLTGSAF